MVDAWYSVKLSIVEIETVLLNIEKRWLSFKAVFDPTNKELQQQVSDLTLEIKTHAVEVDSLRARYSSAVSMGQTLRDTLQQMFDNIVLSEGATRNTSNAMNGLAESASNASSSINDTTTALNIFKESGSASVSIVSDELKAMSDVYVTDFADANNKAYTTMADYNNGIVEDTKETYEEILDYTQQSLNGQVAAWQQAQSDISDTLNETVIDIGSTTTEMISAFSTVEQAYLDTFASAGAVISSTGLDAFIEWYETRHGDTAQPNGTYATGTDYVPRTGMYKLHEGEAVVSPARAQSMANNYASAPAPNQVVNVSVMPNATNVNALLNVAPGDWDKIVLNSIVPSLNRMKARGAYK